MPYPRNSWCKSSYSFGSDECVEVAELWRNPLTEGPQAEEPEKAPEVSCAHAVRDSKHPAQGALLFTTAEWNDFLAAAKAGEFDR